MKQHSIRLYFIDLMRAFAICMMLQGHFTDSLMGYEYRDPNNIFFSIWLYFRGITAPTFFTVSGFIFTYLLVKDKEHTGWNNIRMRKGIKRGFTLLLVGYVLRMNIAGLLIGEVYDGFFMIDVLQCIGLSLLLIITTYLATLKSKPWVMPAILLSATLFLFTIEPIYAGLSFEYLPKMLANYFTKVNGSVFTIFPWFGYAAFGSFMAYIFNYFKENKHIIKYAIGITLALSGLLMFGSSPLFVQLYEWTGYKLFFQLNDNDYLYTRLGNVMLLFSIFMLLQNVITLRKFREIGQNTLSIYIIHFMILYGSFTGLGLYKFFNHALHPYVIIPGAIIFVIVTVFISFKYNLYKPDIDEKKEAIKQEIMLRIIEAYYVIIHLGIKIKDKIEAIFSYSRLR